MQQWPLRKVCLSLPKRQRLPLILSNNDNNNNNNDDDNEVAKIQHKKQQTIVIWWLDDDISAMRKTATKNKLLRESSLVLRAQYLYSKATIITLRVTNLQTRNETPPPPIFFQRNRRQRIEQMHL